MNAADHSQVSLDSPGRPTLAQPAVADGRTASGRNPSGVGVTTSPSTSQPVANDLEVILSAWHNATERLQKTHEVLCGEVRRLNHELEAKNRELVRQNRLADLGHMASHVAHEVRNGLAPVTLYLSLLRRRLRDDDEGLRILDKLDSGFTLLEATVHDMLSFTSDRQPTWRRFALGDLINEVCESLRPQLNAHGLSLSIVVAEGFAVWADPDMLRRALLNLMLNAIDAMPRGGEICLTAASLADGFEMEVADSGPGIPAELIARIFEPFFTTKSDGAGLGLAIVYRVAEAHGGDVRVANCPEGGARVYYSHSPSARGGTGMNRTPVEPQGRVLVVDDHPAVRDSMAETLRCAGHTVNCCGSASEALREFERSAFDVIITDLRMPGINGLEFVRLLEQRRCDAQIVMVTAHGSVAAAVEAMRHGVFDFVEKPFKAEQLESLVARAMRHGELVQRRSTMPASSGQFDAMIGTSPRMQELRQKIAQVAPTSETVLIVGESGVGKELVASAIHAASRRSQGALVSLNCPALSPQLMESELFGHERGAFTSADAPRVGRFELADRGTILLDEVTEISLPLQAKLLRVLQSKTFERVGSSETRSIDVRVLASSNRDLRREVAEGRFREDLFFRLAVVPLPVPPLRERRDDVPLMASHFMALVAKRLDKPPARLDAGAIDLLVNYHWPGNVRELENLVTRASVLRSGDLITADQLRPWLIAPLDKEFLEDSGDARVSLVGMKLDEMERRLIESTLDQFHGHRAQTAKALGIGIRTLTNKLRAYGYAPRAKSFSRAA